MENIEKGATTYLRENTKQKADVLQNARVIRTKDGHLTANLDNGTYWRIYDSVKIAYSLDKVEKLEQLSQPKHSVVLLMT